MDIYVEVTNKKVTHPCMLLNEHSKYPLTLFHVVYCVLYSEH